MTNNTCEFAMRLDRVEAMIPKSGFNVVRVDSFAREIEDEIELVAHFESRDEADAFLREMLVEDPEQVLYIYPSDENDAESGSARSMQKNPAKDGTTTRRLARQAAEAAAAKGRKLKLPAKKKRAVQEKPAPRPLYSHRLVKAFAFAARQHQRHLRKGTATPYLMHPIGVASLVGEYGGEENEMIAALLHDTVEDTGGAPVLAEIRRRFGKKVADIVEGCSDGVPGTDGVKRPWLERKTEYLRHAAEAPLDELRVSAADKLHNLRAILADLRHVGPSVFDRFKAGRDGTLWYYRSLSDVYCAVARDPSCDVGFQRLAGELARSVVELERQAGRRRARSVDGFEPR